jgi:hypothetical protein
VILSEAWLFGRERGIVINLRHRLYIGIKDVKARAF